METQVMTTQEVANRLVELCNQAQFVQAHEELFADNAISFEPNSPMAPKTEGREAISQKVNGFVSAIKEMHGGHTSAPLVTDNQIAVSMFLDATMQDDKRMAMSEMIVYKVEDGKIISENIIY